MIFSGQRNTNGSVGAETLEGPGTTALSQPVASNLTTNGLGSGSATAKPVVKASIVLVGKSTPQPIKSTSTIASSLVGKWQTSQPANNAASRPAGSWW